MPDIINFQEDQDFVHFCVPTKDIPQCEYMPAGAPSYLSSSFQWAKQCLPSKGEVLFSVARNVAAILGCEQDIQDGINIAQGIGQLYGQDSVANREHVSNMLNKHVPDLMARLSSFLLAEQLTQNLVKNVIVNKLAPYGTKAAFGYLSDKIVKELMLKSGSWDKINELFSNEKVADLIAQGVSLVVHKGTDTAKYFSSSVKITKTSILDTNETILVDKNCVREKSVAEIQEAYVHATVIKGMSEMIGAQVEACINNDNNLVLGSGLPQRVSLFCVAKAIRSVIENTIKTQNNTAVSVDLQIANAEHMMVNQGKTIDLLSAAQAIYLPKQSPCNRLKEVQKNWISDKDYLHLVTAREIYVQAYKRLEGLDVRSMEILEYVRGLRDPITFETTQVMQKALMQIKMDKSACLYSLENHVNIDTVQNVNRLNEYKQAWMAPINALAEGIDDEQSNEEILNSSAFKALEIQATKKSKGFFSYFKQCCKDAKNKFFCVSSESNESNNKSRSAPAA